jgi:hypothetical protein
MRRLGRWIRRGFTVVGVLAVFAFGLFLFVGNPLTGGSAPLASTPVGKVADKVVPGDKGNDKSGSKGEDKELLPSEKYGYDDGSKSMAQQIEDAKEAREAYRDFEAQQSGERRVQAQADQALLKDMVKTRKLLDECGVDNADYGAFNFSRCGQLPGVPSTVLVTVAEDHYAISGSAGAATFTDTYTRATLSRQLVCDQPEVGACSASGSWTQY